MKPAERKLRKWRKSSPADSRSFAEKRDRLNKQTKIEIEKHIKHDIKRTIQ